jgi:hypothetical protein
VILTARSTLPAPLGGRGHRDLWRALGLLVLLLPVWGFWAIIAALGSPSSGAGAFWFVGAVWLLVGVLLVNWWNEGRAELVSRVMAWAIFWWLAVLLFPLLLTEGFRRGFVPPPPTTAPQATGPASTERPESLQPAGWRAWHFLFAAVAAVVIEVPLALLWNNQVVSVITLVAVFLLTLVLIRQIRLRRSD